MKKYLRKPCGRCYKMFTPTGDYDTLCLTCFKNSRKYWKAKRLKSKS